MDHYAREGASFFAGNADGRRGWAAAVTLTKVAQLGDRDWALRGRRGAAAEIGARERDYSADEAETFACFWVSLYILLPTYTCRRVSRRCSGLNILARHGRRLSAAFHRALLCV